MSGPPERSDKNKQRLRFGTGEDPHRNNRCDEAVQDDSFPAVQVQNLSAQSATQNEHDGKGGEEETGVEALMDGIKREKGAYGSPDKVAEETDDGRRKGLPTKKGTLFGGGCL